MVPGKNKKQQPRYADVPNCVYADVLGSLNRWNIITFSNKETDQEEFDKVNKWFWMVLQTTCVY